MKKFNPLLALFIFLAIICGLIIGGYFLINLIILPRIAVPEIEKQVSLALGDKLTIKSIQLSPQGIISIRQIQLYQKQDSKVFVRAARIIVCPDYKKIFRSWSKDKNKFDLTLSIELKQAQIDQSPVMIKLNAHADALINLDLKNPENLNYSVKLDLNPMNISSVPVFGEIKDITGSIHISKDAVSTSDIAGTINQAIAKLNFSVKDFTDPQVELHCELSPLSVNLKCGLNQDTLIISQLNAVYNQINLNITGQIDTFKKDPLAQLNSQISIQLEDLVKLPLEFKPVLEKVNPKGLLRADIQVHGPLKNIPKLGGKISLSSDKISALDYVVNNLQVQAAIENGKINLSQLAVNFLGMDLNTLGDLNLMSKSLDYNLRIKLSNLQLENLKDILAKQAKFYTYLSGDINADILVKGQALAPDLITLETNVALKNLIYEQIILPKDIELDTDLSVKNLNTVILRKLMIDDQISQLVINGSLENILSDTKADLSGQLKTKLDKLGTYPLIRLPDDVLLNGDPQIDFKASGLLKTPDKLTLDFTINSALIRYNQFDLADLKLKGSYKEKQLNIPTMLAELYGGQFKASAKADLNNLRNPKFGLEAELTQLDTHSFAEKTKLIQPDFQGLLNAQLNLSGSGAALEELNLKSKLTIDLSKAMVNNIPIEKANAQVNADYKDNSIILNNCALVYKDIQVQAKGAVSSLSKAPRADLDISSKLDTADLNKLPLPLDTKKQLDELGLKGSVSLKTNIAAVVSDLTAMKLTVEILSDKLEVKKIILNNININAQMQNKLLNAAASLKAYQGQADLKAKADFNNKDTFSYTAKADINKLDIGQLIQESQIIAQPDKGIVSLTADISGQGQDLKTLKGKANLKLTDGLIVGMGMLKTFAGIFKADFLANFVITQGNADIIFDKGKATLDNTSFNGPDANILARGGIFLDTLGFDDFWATLALTDSGAQQMNQDFLRSVFDLNGQTYQKDIEVKGTVSAPIIDQKKILGGLVTNTIINQLFKADQPSDNSEQPQSGKDAKMELFKGVLNGLFKK